MFWSHCSVLDAEVEEGKWRRVAVAVCSLCSVVYPKGERWIEQRVVKAMATIMVRRLQLPSWHTKGLLVLLPAAVLAPLLVLAASCGGADGGESGAFIAEGAVAPDFTLSAANGESVRLSDYVGEANVLLYFSMGSG